MDGLREEYRLSLLVLISQLNCWLVKGTGEHTVMMQSQSNPHSSQKKKITATLISKQKKKNKKRTKLYPLKYSAGSFVLEGIVWSGDAHEERVVSGVFAAVIHEVCRGLGYLRKHWNLVALLTPDRQQFSALRNKLYSQIKQKQRRSMVYICAVPLSSQCSPLISAAAPSAGHEWCYWSCEPSKTSWTNQSCKRSKKS